MFSHHFKRDFEAVTRRLRDGPSFALARFNDGEFAVLRDKPYKAASGWRTRGKTWLGTRLRAALAYKDPAYFVGISPLCCIPPATSWYRTNVGVSSSNLTFATIFFNSNYRAALSFFSQLDAVKVGCARACDIRTPADAVNQRWDVDAVVDKMLECERPILLAAGPASCVLAHRYWSRADPATRQSVVDVGAVLDTVIHGRPTRDYQKGATSAALILRHSCSWDSVSKGRHPVSNEPNGFSMEVGPATGFSMSTEVGAASAMAAAAVGAAQAPRAGADPNATPALPAKKPLDRDGWRWPRKG